MKKTFLTVIILILIVNISSANYKDLDQCTLNNNNPICTGKVEIKTSIIKKEPTEKEIIITFFQKFIEVIYNLELKRVKDNIKINSYMSNDQ